MSVVSLSTFEDLDNDEKSRSVQSPMDMRRENDTRRIKVNQMMKEQPDMYARGRPGTAPAPFSPSRSGGADVSTFAIEGPKRRAVTRANNNKKLSQSTSSLNVGGVSPQKLTNRPRSSQSPSSSSRRRSASPLKNIREGNDGNGGDNDNDNDEEDNGGAFLTSATARRLVARDVLSERDNAALKMGRLILQTLMDKPEITTEDSVSRFFFDNWLAKSGSNSQQADSYSIELMSHLQAQITLAKAEAEDEIQLGNSRTLSQQSNSNSSGNEGENQNAGEIKEGADENKMGEQPTTSPPNTSAEGEGSNTNTNTKTKLSLTSQIDPSVVQVLGEKTSLKTVGAVAMEAFDRCILEFGKSNPILSDVKSALLPLIFADNADMESLEDPIRKDKELDGSKYLNHSTWLEDAHFMYEHAEKQENEKNRLKYSIRQNSEKMEKMKNTISTQKSDVEPLQKKAIQLQVDLDTAIAGGEQLALEKAATEGELQAEKNDKASLQALLEDSRSIEKAKEVEIVGLKQALVDMQEDKNNNFVPISEHQLSTDTVVKLTEENIELEEVIKNLNIMLQSQKRRDAESEEFLKVAKTDVDEMMEKYDQKLPESQNQGDLEGAEGQMYVLILILILSYAMVIMSPIE